MIFQALNLISMGYYILYCQTSDYFSPILDALPKIAGLVDAIQSAKD